MNKELFRIPWRRQRGRGLAGSDKIEPISGGGRRDGGGAVEGVEGV